MVVFDSEHICTRCKRRIKKGHEVWLHADGIRYLPYGPECARIIRAKDKQLPERSAPGVSVDIDFERFRTTGVGKLEKEE